MLSRNIDRLERLEWSLGTTIDRPQRCGEESSRACGETARIETTRWESAQKGGGCAVLFRHSRSKRFSESRGVRGSSADEVEDENAECDRSVSDTIQIV